METDMGDVLIAFLAICITCAAVLAGASSLYRVLAVRSSAAPRETADTVLVAQRGGALQQCVSRAHNWARARRIWRPRAAHPARGAARKGIGQPAA
jgi:hypothetical protein